MIHFQADLRKVSRGEALDERKFTYACRSKIKLKVGVRTTGTLSAMMFYTSSDYNKEDDIVVAVLARSPGTSGSTVSTALTGGGPGTATSST